MRFPHFFTHRIVVAFGIGLLVISHPDCSGAQEKEPNTEDVVLKGRVVSQHHDSCHEVQVATFWRANGTGRKPDGTPMDLDTDEQLVEFWGNVGQMETTLSHQHGTCSESGEYQVTVGWRKRALLAMDKAREFGGLVEFDPAAPADDLKIELRPLTIVQAKLESVTKDKPAQWSHVYVLLPENSDRPLASNRLVSCGSYSGKVEFRLPPGKYELQCYGVSDAKKDAIDLHARKHVVFEVAAGKPKLDLGTIELLEQQGPGFDELKKESKASGRWSDYTEHYGELAPEWNATQTRGIAAGKNIAAYRGKWLILNFWGPSCAPCLRKSVPKLTRFYEKNAKHRDQFETVGICICFEGEPQTLEALDNSLKDVVKKVWNNKPIPYPIVLDTTFKSWERFGISGLGTTILIDPEGKLVEGDLETLREILESGTQPVAGK